MKKLYVAARSTSAGDVKHLWELLAHQYEPAFDWTSAEVYSPESDMRNQEIAKACLEAAIAADGFVLIDNNTFNGAFGAIVEYGAAVTHGVPCVIVKPLTRESIFMTLPNVRIVESVDDVEQAINDIKSQLDS